MNHAVFTRDRLLTVVLAVMTAIAVYVCYLIVEPFIPAIAFALALAIATARPYAWLKRRLHREALAAAIATVLVAVVIIAPAAALITYIVQLAADNIGEMQKGGGIAAVRDTLERLPLVGRLIQEAGTRFRLDEQLGTIAQAVAQRGTRFLSGSIGVLTQLGVTLFVLFFLYRDCGEAVNSVRKLLPLSNDEADRMFERVGSTIQATVNGSLTVAAVQAILAGIVYAILGVPGAVLWGAVTFICALIPVFGTFLVWAPIALYLAATGSVIKAAFLIGWGAVVVGSVDNLLYPYLVGDKLRMHTVPTFFAILGGLSLFGPAGLILGPMALAIAIAILDVWWERTEEGHGAEEALSRAPAPHEQVPGEVLQKRS
jgi:predicted PurR-regulated permease PerM